MEPPRMQEDAIMEDEMPSGRVLTRIRNVIQPDFDPDKPRIGRRESEPHSAEVGYLFDVLGTNFLEDRTTWDLHHYFKDPLDPGSKDDEYDIQYDISYFRGLKIAQELPSYKAVEHGNAVPTMAVNVLSKSTWAVDLSDHVDKSRLLGIPLYVVFPAYHVATTTYKPPFLRAYIYQSSTRQHVIHDLKQAIVKEGEPLSKAACDDPEKLLDTSSIVPFRIGLMERNVQVKGGFSAWRMILVHPTEPRMFLTRAEQEKARAEQEKARADELERVLSRYKERFGSLN
ncbi:MAG: hypothetical protein GYA24_24140 [Candidatus Lokiarchaeota archaeon]|nr:hypothetical protein [Candidatus Lokiarchaeota archaeon]